MYNEVPLITIITPTYNRKYLLEKAIISVINQKQEIPFVWELIIVDDWSTDQTKDYIQKYLNDNINIKYFYQDNSWVGKARNVWLDNTNKKSDYLIFLDSDDELIYDCIFSNLKKYEDFKNYWKYDQILWFYNLCIDENWNIIWNKKILDWKKEIYFDYNSFLNLEINVEMLFFSKSYIFTWELNLRFEEDIITEWVMRAKMWKYMDQNKLKVCLIDYIWRLYNISHSWEEKITKTISCDRFRKNAIWNERVLDVIWEDLLKRKKNTIYSEYLFRAWINWMLFWDKKKWFSLLKKSLKVKFSLLHLIIYVISIISTKMLLTIYKMYI